MTTTTLTITPLVIPASVSAPDAAELHALVELANTLCQFETGHNDLDETAEEVLPGWLDQTDRGRIGLIARREGRIVGAMTMGYAKEEGSTAAEFDILVLPEDMGAGIEDALLDAAENEVRALGRRSAQTWSMHSVSREDPQLTPRTGWGSVSLTPRTEFFTRRGYSLEQVERNSAFDLRVSLNELQNTLAEAERFAGADYRTVSWTVPTPPEYQDGYAQVLARMATDAPSGDLDIDEEVWDAARVQRRDANFLDSGCLFSVTAVEHVPSGELVAFNELLIGADRTGVTQQYSTLVMKAHRGHHLGMIVKCANLLRWQELAPDSPRVTTFNAEENRPMLSINESLGFVPTAYASVWQKEL